MESETPRPKSSKRRAPHIRPVNRETRHVALRRLACFQQIHDKLLEGWSSIDIARWVQMEMGEATDIPVETLKVQVDLYRSDLPPAMLASIRRSTSVSNAVKKIEKGLDELKSLEDLYHLQMERIQIDFSLEKRMGKLVPSMTQEIRTAREILSSIADLKMDLGLNGRHLGTVEVDAHLTAHVAQAYGGNPRIAAVLSNPERRQRLLGVAAALMSKAGSNVIEAEAVEVREAEEAAEAAEAAAPEEPDLDEPREFPSDEEEDA